jgi:SOS-response transcriptional repressor LexA
VICKYGSQVNSGDIVHYTLNGESGIKKVKINEDSGVITFIPLNPTYETTTYTKDEIHDIRMSKCSHVISGL